MAERLTGDQLMQALEDSSLSTAPDTATIVGIVKVSSVEGCVSFSSGNPEGWVDLPSSLVREAEKVGECPCSGEKHPIMRLILSDPATEAETALQSLITQLQHSQMTLGATTPTPPTEPPTGSVTAMIGGGGGYGAGYGDMFDGRRTLPVCGPVSYKCGSNLPDAPEIWCTVWCCYWPSSGYSNCPGGARPGRTF